MDNLFDTIRDRLADASLEVYVSNWCFDCRRLKGLLDEHGIEYSTVNISSEPAAADRLERETGKRGVPYVLVNGKSWVRGYHRDQPGKFNPTVLVNELAEAL